MATGDGGPRIRELTAGEEIDDIEDDDDDFEDETILERILALSEMFPESLRNASTKCVDLSISASLGAWSKGKGLLWILVSSASVLVLPIILESERAQVHEQQEQQRRQILLGPGASGGGGMVMGPAGVMPPLAPPLQPSSH